MKIIVLYAGEQDAFKVLKFLCEICWTLLLHLHLKCQYEICIYRKNQDTMEVCCLSIISPNWIAFFCIFGLAM